MPIWHLTFLDIWPSRDFMRTLFASIQHAGLNEQVASAPVILANIGLNIAVTVDSGNAVLFKNGTLLGTSGTVSDGDSLTIEVTSSATYATPTFTVITLGGQQSVFTVCTLDDVAQDQLIVGFGILRKLAVPVNTQVTSNVVTITGLGNGIGVTASVPQLYGALLYKNGVPVGTSTTVFNLDTLFFSFTTPALPGIAIDFPIAVGNFSTSFISTTPLIDITVDPFYFTDVNNAALNTAFTSNTITVSGIDASAQQTLTTSAGSIVLNGTDTGLLTATVKLGDTFAIKLSTGSEHGDIQYVDIDVGTVSAPWSITTLAAPGFKYLDPIYKGIGAKDANLMGIQNNVGNLVRISLADLSVASWSFVQGQIPDPADATLPLYLAKELLRFYTTENPSTDVTTYRFVSSTDDTVYDSLKDIYIDVPGNPRELALVGSTLYVLIASGLVAVLTPDGNDVYSVTSTINTGGYPYAINVDDSNAVWVSDLATDSIYKIVGNAVVQTITGAGAGVWSMASTSTHLWTANSYDNTVSKISLVTGNVEATIAVSSVPSLITVDPHDGVWVGHYGTQTLIELDTVNNSIVSNITLPSTGSAGVLIADSDYLWVIENGYDVATIQNKLSLAMPAVITFTDQLGVAANSTISSNVAFVTGLTRPVMISIAPSTTERLYVNGTLVITEALVNNGDLVRVEVDVPSTYDTDIQVAVKSYQSSSTFHIHTELFNIPDPVFFISQFDARVGKTQISNSVEIVGLSASVFINLKTSNPRWSIILNGVKLAVGDTPLVKNGDIVAITGPAEFPYGEEFQYSILYKPSTAVDSSYTELGTLSITNKILLGAIKGPQRYELRTWQSQYMRNAEMHYEEVVSPQFDAVSSNFSVSTDSASYQLMRNSLAKTGVSSGTTQTVHRILTGSATLDMVSAIRNVKTKVLAVDSSYAVNTKSQFATTEVAEYERSAVRDSIQATAEYERSNVYASRNLLAEYERSAVRDSVQATAEYERSVVRDSIQATAEYERSNVYASRNLLAEYERPAVRDSVQITAEYERSNVRSVLTTAAQYDVGAKPVIQYVTMNDWVQIQAANSISDSVEFTNRVHRRLFIVPADHQIGAISMSAHKFVDAEVNSATRGAVKNQFLAPMVTPVLLNQAIRLADAPTALYTRKRLVEISESIYTMPYMSVNDFTLSEGPQIEGAYETEALAIAAGIAEGYTGVYAVLTSDGYYVWAVPASIQDTGCGILIPTAPVFAFPVKWYIHGG